MTRRSTRAPLSAALLGAATIGVLAIGLSGCAKIERQETRSKEQLMAASGFVIRPADTPEKLAKLQAMKQNKLIQQSTSSGQVQFLYADATVCRCLYVGDQQAYQAYQSLAVQQQIAQADREAALDASMDAPWAYDGWWGPVGPY